MVESEKLEKVGCGKMVPVLRRPNFRTKDPTVNAYSKTVMEIKNHKRNLPMLATSSPVAFTSKFSTGISPSW